MPAAGTCHRGAVAVPHSVDAVVFRVGLGVAFAEAAAGAQGEPRRDATHP